MSNLYRRPSIVASYPVSVHLWLRSFRGEDFCFKSANQKQESFMATMFVNGSKRNEYSLQRIFHRCFLISFTSFDWGVSEEKIKMWIVNGRQTTNERRRTTDAKWWYKLTLPLARWANNSQWVDMSLHSDTLFWFRANQSLLFLLNAAFLAEKQQITNVIFFCLTRPQFVPTIYRTWGEHANHYATDAVPYFYFLFIIFLIKISYCPSIYYLKTKINLKQ
jgi:hypothetical protein